MNLPRIAAKISDEPCRFRLHHLEMLWSFFVQSCRSWAWRRQFGAFEEQSMNPPKPEQPLPQRSDDAIHSPEESSAGKTATSPTNSASGEQPLPPNSIHHPG